MTKSLEEYCLQDGTPVTKPVKNNLFEVAIAYAPLVKGSVLALHSDDQSSWPLFKVIFGEINQDYDTENGVPRANTGTDSNGTLYTYMAWGYLNLIGEE